MRNQDELWSSSPYPPRDWQSGALESAVNCVRDGENGVVSAVMGAGKSLVIGALLDWWADQETSQGMGWRSCVVSTPTIQLVDQLYTTIAEFVGPTKVGKYYTHQKEPEPPIVVACIPSVQSLFQEWNAREDDEIGLWVADECHRTECDSIKDPYNLFDVQSLIGFSATPFRNLEDEALTLFDKELYDYPPTEAIQDGVIVPPKLVHYEGSATDVETACVRMIDDLHVDDPMRGIVNSTTIEEADDFADRLCEEGYQAAAVHSRKEDWHNDKAIEDLKSGALDIIVHVNMLSEGVDFPWLKWLCLKRPISSKVRFCQEVGRALRAYEGKDHAKILDPHDLFNVFNLNYETALGLYEMEGLEDHEEQEHTIEEALDEMLEAGDLQIHFDLDDHGTPVEVLDPVQSWLRQCRLELESEGYIDPEVTSTHWRSDPASANQKQYISHLRRRFNEDLQHYLSERRRKAFKTAFRCLEKGSLTKGDASDLIELLTTLKEIGHWPEEIDG